MKSKVKFCSRAQTGITLVELLIVTLIMSFVSSAALGMLVLISNDSLKAENKIDNVSNARNALEKMTRVIREGIQLGDIFGNTNINNAPIPNATMFPNIYDPIYGQGQTPSGGAWGQWDDNTSVNQVYTLNNQTLVVQRPIYDLSGYPYGIPNTAFQVSDPVLYASNQGAGVVVMNYITDIYRVLPDPTNPGQWEIQFTELPGWVPSGAFANYYTDANGVANPYNPVTIPPTVILRGIVGPIGANGPRVFQFCEDLQGPNPGTYDTVNDPNNIGFYSSVSINLEIKNSNNTAAGINKTATTGYRTQIYLRNQ